VQYPLFFECVESIILKDPLSDVLGAFEEGIVEFTYLDVVKSAGHSCPTVAGAYLMTWKALEALYPDSVPVRLSPPRGEPESLRQVSHPLRHVRHTAQRA